MAKKLLVTRRSGRTRAIHIGPGVVFGAGLPVVIAGPCSVESREQILETARAVRAAGGKMLRGGAFKPRTSPYTFQGLGEEGLKLLAEAREATGLPVTTEVLDDADVPLVSAYADVLQIGARNMQNFALLRAVGRTGRPVLLKRGPGATLDEWLHAAEYILKEGNEQVILCERGIRTFEPYTRHTLDLGSALAAKRLTALPVIADPSHASGRRELVPPLVKAALASGLDGVIVEVHPDPDASVSDAAQSLSTDGFRQLMEELHLKPTVNDPAGLRRTVDAIDLEILSLIVRRATVAERLRESEGPEQSGDHRSLNDQAILKVLTTRTGDWLSKDAIRDLWEAVLVHSRKCSAATFPAPERRRKHPTKQKHRSAGLPSPLSGGTGQRVKGL